MFSLKGPPSVGACLLLLLFSRLSAFPTVAADETEVQPPSADNLWSVKLTTTTPAFASESQRLPETVDASAAISSSSSSSAAAATTTTFNNSAAATEATDVAFNASSLQSPTTDMANRIQLQQLASSSSDAGNVTTTESADDLWSNSGESETNKPVAVEENEVLSPSNVTSMTAGAQALDTTAAEARKSRDIGYLFSNNIVRFLLPATFRAIYSNQPNHDLFIFVW
jgi:hypothetical protein